MYKGGLSDPVAGRRSRRLVPKVIGRLFFVAEKHRKSTDTMKIATALLALATMVSAARAPAWSL